MDAKRIIILIVLLVGLVIAGKYACNAWNKYHPKPPPPTPAPAPTPAAQL